jgi:hypothetical protein
MSSDLSQFPDSYSLLLNLSHPFFIFNLYFNFKFLKYSYGHGILSVILLSIRKNLCNLSFIVIMTDIQNFCDRNSVTHNKN